MKLQVALMLSVVLQFAAFAVTISLIPKTRFKIAWISISAGFLLMALRRFFEGWYQLDTMNTFGMVSSWVAVVISVAMLIASLYIRRIFQVLNRIQQLHRDNEARLLTAVITTEEKERKYFAREIHDGLGPLLSAARMTLSALNRASLSEQNAELIGKVESLVDNAITSSKEIANHLTPHVLEHYGLRKAVETYVKNTVSRKNIRIELNTNLEKRRYPNPIEVILYRICCELISNTLKYADAGRISILLTERPGFLSLQYDDDGKGCHLETSDAQGMGLTNIRSRVKSLNGSLEMHSDLNRGFYAHIQIPI